MRTGRVWTVAAAVCTMAMSLVGGAAPAQAARGISNPTAPHFDEVADTIVITSQYHQDWGDPRCPSGIDESRHDCVTRSFSLYVMEWGAGYVAVSPQHGCGTQDSCTYPTSVPCRRTWVDPPEIDLWKAMFEQVIINVNAQGPQPPRFDRRHSPDVFISRCQVGIL